MNAKGARQVLCLSAVALAFAVTGFAVWLSRESASATGVSLFATALLVVLLGGLGHLGTVERVDLSLGGRVAKGLGLWGGESTTRTLMVVGGCAALGTTTGFVFGGGMRHLKVQCNEARSLSWVERPSPPDPKECKDTPQAIHAWRPLTSTETFLNSELWCNFDTPDGGAIAIGHPTQLSGVHYPICIPPSPPPATLLAGLPPPSNTIDDLDGGSIHDASSGISQRDGGGAALFITRDGGTTIFSRDAGLPIAHDAGALVVPPRPATPLPTPPAPPTPFVQSIVMSPGTGYLFDTKERTSGPAAPRHIWWNRVELVPAHDVLVADTGSPQAQKVDRTAFTHRTVLVPKPGSTFTFLLPTKPTPTAVFVHVDGVSDDLRLTYHYPVPVR